MSKRQFEVLDICAFSIIGIVTECINIWAFSKLGGLFYVSFAVVLGLISMVRWNAWGFVVSVVAGLSSVVYQYLAGDGLTLNWLLANTVGYLPLLINLVWFKSKDKKAITSNLGLSVLFVITGFLETEVGKAMCYAGSHDLTEALLRFFAYDLINMGLGCVVFFIAIKQKSLVVDMNKYLVDIHSSNAESQFRAGTENYHALEEMADKDEVSDIALLDGGMLNEDDLKKMNDVYKNMEGTPSKYDVENQAVKQYKKDKAKNRGKKQ